VLGVKLGQLDLWAPIRELVRIPQKRVKFTPAEKLYDVFVACLAGAKGIVESEHKLRADPALQAAFGRTGCAEQSVLQDTLNACTEENVRQIETACQRIYRQQSQGYRHDYAGDWQLLDVDVSGMPCGKKAACATKGYFQEGKNRRGRQLGRVLATRYAEIVADRLYPGNVQLVRSFPELVEAAEATLELDEVRRRRTLLRVDAGGGTIEHVNWVLGRGYHYHGKDYSGERAQALAETVSTWYPDPRVPGREVGWVTEASPYERMVYRIAVRCRDLRKPQHPGKVCLLLSTLSPEEILILIGEPRERRYEPATVLLAYVYFYDQRGGGIETSLKEDKQGLGITKRNKKRFEAQAVLTQLNALAHNVLVWAKGWLAAAAPCLKHYGIPRLLRDVFSIPGVIESTETQPLVISRNYGSPALLVKAVPVYFPRDAREEWSGCLPLRGRWLGCRPVVKSAEKGRFGASERAGNAPSGWKYGPPEAAVPPSPKERESRNYGRRTSRKSGRVARVARSGLSRGGVRGRRHGELPPRR
jgi:hypothetical protein